MRLHKNELEAEQVCQSFKTSLNNKRVHSTIMTYFTLTIYFENSKINQIE